MSTHDRGIVAAESGGSIVEAAGGIAVMVLAIIGLAQSGNEFMTAIATIVLGVALMAEGGAIAAHMSRLLGMATAGGIRAADLGSGMTAEFLAGGAAIVLGILALVGLHPAVLLAAAVIAVGASLVLTAGAVEKINQIRLQAAGMGDMALDLARLAVSGAVGTQVLIGIAAMVLGIVGLVSASEIASLTLVGLLVLGASLIVTGTALAGGLLRLFCA
jgi:hypothetical protein